MRGECVSAVAIAKKISDAGSRERGGSRTKKGTGGQRGGEGEGAVECCCPRAAQGGGWKGVSLGPRKLQGRVGYSGCSGQRREQDMMRDAAQMNIDEGKQRMPGD